MSVVVLFLRAGDTWRPHVIAHGAVAVGCLAYLALLLYTYLFGFGPYEGTRVVGFGRYAGSWFLAWMLVVLATVGSTPLRSGAGEIAAVLLLVSVLAWGDVRVRSHPEPVVPNARGGVQALVARVEGSLPQGAKTYLIWQGTTGLEFHLLAYELTPRRTNVWCWTVGEKFTENDVWTCPLSPKEWADALADFEFVVIGHADESFWTRYRSLFASGSAGVLKHGLYKITRSAGGVRLEPTSQRE
jgi:hypothetical protein